MRKKIFKKLISLNEALSIVKDKLLRVNRVVLKEVFESIGYLSAEDIYSSIDVPLHSKSEVDGYAVKCIDLAEVSEVNPVKLKLIGRISVDEVFNGIVRRGECVELATGSMIPVGAEAVVPLEYTEERDGYVYFYRGVSFYQNVLPAGFDIEEGELVIRLGELITPLKVSALASIGVKRVKVFDKPVIGVISTGSEVVELGSKISIGKTFDVNSHLLASMILERGAKVKLFGVVEDDLNSLVKRVEEALKQVDLLIITGGSSIGGMDIVYRVFEEVGSKLEFHGLSIKPGKPTGFGLIDGKPVFCLPGNPLSAYISFTKLVLEPLLKEKFKRFRVKAKLIKGIHSRSGRTEYVPVILIKMGSEFLSYPLTGSSASIRRLFDSNGFVEIPGEVECVEAGEYVLVDVLEKPADVYLFGHKDPVIKYLCGSLSKALKLNLKMIREGFEEALTHAYQTSGLASVIDPEFFYGKEWVKLLEYRLTYGLSFKKGCGEPLRIVLKSSLRMRRITFPKDVNVVVTGYVSSDSEVFSLMEKNLIDGGITYRRKNGYVFKELGGIRVGLLAHESFKLIDELKLYFESKELLENLKKLYPYVELNQP